ncbi:MAG: hypothetical protein AAF696_07195 [Bacteroidota bacterium]
MQNAPQISIPEIISLIQEESYAAIGMDKASVHAFFQKEKNRITKFQKERPDYLKSREEILAEDSSLHYMELDLARRFDTEVFSPFQHPYLYSWLKDVWRYHCEKLYGTEKILDKEILLATAPSGRFNAMALAGSKEHGILFEDGLINVIVGISNNIAFLLYDKLDNGQYLEKTLEEIEPYSQKFPELLHNISTIIYDYVVGGYSHAPPPFSDAHQDDFSIRTLISSACWSFIFEHELYHLKVHDGIQLWQNQDFLDKRYGQVWKFFNQNLLPVLPLKIEETEFKKRYLAHQEELFADYFALHAVAKLGDIEGIRRPNILGVLSFFLIAELTEHLILKLTEPGTLESFSTADGLTISLTAILMNESHPYAFARRKGLFDGAKIYIGGLDDELSILMEKMELLLNLLKKQINGKLLENEEGIEVHSKWTKSKEITAKHLHNRGK